MEQQRQLGAGDALIEMDGVHKRFGNGTLAVEGMSVSIQPGEFVSFLGPSGCGKSTALRMIAGLLSASAGSITVNGHPAGEGGDGRDVGFVFQEATLMPWANVFDNVYLPLRLAGASRKAATPEVEEALAMVGLSSFRSSYPRELSGGMKMRVSIARAMVTRPALLLMDEPFAALDEMTRFKLNNDVLKLWEEHKLTVIFVTHSVFESVYLSNRVMVMAARPGRVVNDIALPGGYPRTDAYRTSQEFAENTRLVTKALEGTLSHAEIDH
ncbi:ABC transporter ATP-binding protein [Nitratireductor sp. XY-223]|uniref:ABC transporter ATP-binding protein n=1 Tax=Nitratireductor sp. XY-223 TaxID=2561926 RepID=UPI0010AA6CDD|nr:ABC transporter ATP-binding protein [Nitratireductor sp. XY-223]